MRISVSTVMLIALLGAPLSHAASPQQITGTVKLNVSQATSMTDLENLLEKRGYTDIHLTPVKPNQEDPRPDVQGTSGPAKLRANPNTTAIHYGWNGTAVHNGKLVSIVIDKNGALLEK